MLIDTFVNAVVLYDDKIVMTYNNKKDAKTLSLAEIEEMFRSDLTTPGVPCSYYLFISFSSSLYG